MTRDAEHRGTGTDDATSWFVYVLQSTTCARTYVGIATDVDRRLQQHNGEMPGGARSTRSGRPWRVAAVRAVDDRAGALRLEHRVKRATGARRFSALHDEPR